LIRPTRRSILWPLVVALGALAQSSHAQVAANAVPVKTYTGFFNNTAVYFTAFETNSPNFAAVNGLVYAPRLSNSNRAGLAPMIFFMNGGAGQTVALQTEPGRADYSPLWNVWTAWWRGPGPMPLITSFGAAIQWWRIGRLLIQTTGIVFNGPVIVINRPLGVLGGGQLAPTISPQEFFGINPAARTAFFAGHQGYWGGQVVTFLALEHAPGVIAQAPGAIPVPAIDLNHLGHAAIDNFFVAPGQPPVLDAFPVRQVVVTPGTTSPPPTTGTPSPTMGIYGGIAGIAGQPGPLPSMSAGQTGQQGAVASVEAVQQASSQLPPFSLPPYAGLYSPIWHVHHVVWRPGVTPRLLASLQDIQAVLSAGLAVQIDGGIQDTFNCPVTAAIQPIPTTPLPTVTPTTPPVTPTPTPVTPTPTPVVTPTPPPAPMVSFSRDILRIFTNNGAKTCAQAGCHSGPNPQMGQNLSATTAYTNIVNVPSMEKPSLLRVKPGDAANSYLYQKITGAPGIVGSMMPLAGGPLSASDMALIQQWINAGAPNN
jgi:hypothetical protein